tara:strand:+ start:64 stop:903 length:840 start_codon:yes stop_codon:yes gene_type:complete
MENLQACLPPNFGWLEAKLDQTDIDHLWECIDNSKKNDYRSHLAGNISDSNLIYDIDHRFFDNVLVKCCEVYNENFPMYMLQDKTVHSTTQQFPIKLSSMWVNYQKQHEFQPVHTHSGIYSFVVFMKIPTRYEDQLKFRHTEKTNSQRCVSNFQFQYINNLGKIDTYSYVMSPETEGTILFFPSRLNHTVYPFYQCEEDRITISGNLSFHSDDAFPIPTDDGQSGEDPISDVKKTTPSEWSDWNRDRDELVVEKPPEVSEKQENLDKKWWNSEWGNSHY